MEIKLYEWNSLDNAERQKIMRRSETDIDSITEKVKLIIDRVRSDGDAALIDFTKKFDGAILSPQELRVPLECIEAAAQYVDKRLQQAIDKAIENVQKFHESQRVTGMSIHEILKGLFVGEKVTPIDSLGIYIPHGRGRFPSMFYMLAVPALIAGVPRIVAVTPPATDGSLDDASLYVAKKLGITEMYRVGGAQAIAALAYGTESIKPVDKLSGPGSAYVAAAKRILSGVMDVGLPAGPSESIVLSDGAVAPELAANDLLVEAEHGSDSCALLITPDSDFAGKVMKTLEKIIPSIPEPRRKFITDVLTGGYGGIILTDSMEQAISVTNDFAPEHLEILSRDPFSILGSIRNAGEILLGENIPFSCANYLAGVNAVLPTGGKAKTWSAVSVRDFVKISSVVWATRGGYQSIAAETEVLARYEGFVTHANAVQSRFSGDSNQL